MIWTEGCVPLCGRWGSFAEMLAFFPNVEEVVFNSAGEAYQRDARADHPNSPPARLWLKEEIRVEGSTVCPARKRWFPEGLDFECWYNLDDGTEEAWTTAQFDRDSEGELILPDVFLLPAHMLSVWGSTEGSNAEWLPVLRRRKDLSIETHCILWSPKSVEELDVLAEVAGHGLLTLEVLCYAGVCEWSAHTAIAILNRIDAERFPELTALKLRITFPYIGHVPPDTAGLGYQLLSQDMPPRLSSIELILVLDTWEVDEGDTDSEKTPASYAEYIFEGKAPLAFIAAVRSKFGDDFDLSVQTQYTDGDKLVDYTPSKSAYLNYVMKNPLERVISPGVRNTIRRLQGLSAEADSTLGSEIEESR